MSRATATNDQARRFLQLPLRIFLASPSDVRGERRGAVRLIERLNKHPLLTGRVRLEPLSWDDPDAPLSLPVNLTPQQAVKRGLAEPSDCDIVVVLFWNRMGTELDPSEGLRNGKPYRSGTEWEFYDALNAETQPERPVILLYRRTGFIPDASDPDDPEFQEELDQRRKVNAFFEELWQEKKRRPIEVASPNAFAKRLENDLLQQIRPLSEPQPPPIQQAMPAAVGDARLAQAEARLTEPSFPAITAGDRIFLTLASEDKSEVRFPPFGDLLIGLRMDGDDCELVVSELDGFTEHVVARVPPGKWQHGMREVIYIDDDRAGPDGGSFTETFQSQELVLTDRHGAIRFRDLFVDNRGYDCSARFYVEFTPDAQRDFDK